MGYGKGQTQTTGAKFEGKKQSQGSYLEKVRLVPWVWEYFPQISYYFLINSDVKTISPSW